MPYIGEANAEQRIAELEKMSDAAGLRLPKTYFPPGTSLLAVGAENQRRMAEDVDKLPDVAAGVVTLKARIAAEAPHDIKGVPVQLIRMAPGGGLFSKDKTPVNALAYTHAGFSHVAQFVKPSTIRAGFAENILAIPDSNLRAAVWNSHAEHAVRAEKVTLRTILTPENGGRRVIRAVTSHKHSLETGDDLTVCAALERDESFKGAKMRVTREHDRTDFEILWPAMNRELTVGDLCIMGVRVTNSETKAGALRCEAFIKRVLCRNFTTADSEDMAGEEITARHVGDLRYRLPRMMARALARIDPFVKRFADAYKVPLAKTRGEVLASVGKKFELTEGTLNLAGQLWDADGDRSAGSTLAGLVNALTRASQVQTMSAAVLTEKVAGQLTRVEVARQVGLV